jgi:hypothetical protein
MTAFSGFGSKHMPAANIKDVRLRGRPIPALRGGAAHEQVCQPRIVRRFL